MPVPFPTTLVVKKGVKISSKISEAIPLPVSVIASSIQSPLMDLWEIDDSVSRPLAQPKRIPSLPSPSMASREFIQRFITICCNCVGFIKMQGSLSSITVSSSIVEGKVARSISISSLSSNAILTDEDLA